MAYSVFGALADGFCFHRMWYMILPIPYGFAFTLSHMVIFYLLHKKFPPNGNAGKTAAGDDGNGSPLNPTATANPMVSDNPLEAADITGSPPADDDDMLTPGRF
jgi:hypothetical protein